MTISEIRNQYRSKKLNALELTKDYIARIKKDQSQGDGLNAYITLTEDLAMNMAKQADERLLKGESNGLLGIPIAIKDNINIEGVPTTCASKILTNYVSPYDAFVVKRLKDAGAIFLGKTNMDEFAMGSSTESSFYGITRNPNDRSRVPGGSSGGSAASIKGDLAVVALGSDTGGSIRQPAHFCGVVGLKPTYGRVSRFGLVAFASSLDQIGPLANTVEDAAITLEAIAGHDDQDSTSYPSAPEAYTSALNQDVKGKTIGIPKEYFGDTIRDDIKQAVQTAIDTLKVQGCSVKNIDLPHTAYGVPAYYVIATAEASSNLGRFDGIRYGFRAEGNSLEEIYINSRSQGFGSEVKRRIMLGTYALSAGYFDAYYLKAQKIRTLIRKDFEKAFAEVDAIITPVAPSTAFTIGEMVDDPLTMYQQDILTITINLAGLPALVLPVGKDDKGLPIGMQIIGNYFKESTILNLGQVVEKHLS